MTKGMMLLGGLLVGGGAVALVMLGKKDTTQPQPTLPPSPMDWSNSKQPSNVPMLSPGPPIPPAVTQQFNLPGSYNFPLIRFMPWPKP